MVRLLRIATLSSALCAWSVSARGESYNPNSVPERGPPLLELGAAVFARYDNGEHCDVDGDLVSCSSGRAFIGGAVVPRLRLWPSVSLGVLGAYAVAPGSEGTTSSDGSHSQRALTTYRFEGEARLHPLYQEGPDLWLAFDVGVTALHDSWESFDTNDRSTGTESNTVVGPIAGAGVGIDFHVLPFLALGPELRGGVMKYGSSGNTALHQNEDPEFFVSLGLTGTLLVRP